MSNKSWPLALLASSGLVGGCASEAAAGRPWIHAVELRGVSQVSRGDLRARIALEETSWVPLAPKHFLDPFAVDDDRARIEAWYRARGYYAARVTDAEVVLRPGGRSADVRFTVEEGAPVRIADLRTFGTDRLDRESYGRATLLDLRHGQVFDHDLYLAQKDAIAATLRGLGYPWAEVAGEAAVDRDHHVANLVFTVVPGPWAAFDEVVVRGTASVDPRLVVGLAAIERGAPFREQALETARAKVYGAGVFSWVKVDYERVADRPDRVRVVITVREAPFNDLRLGGGFGLESQRSEVRVQAIYTRRNFLGGLRTLQLRIAPAYVAIPAVWDLHRHGPAGVAESVLTQPRIGFLSQIQWTVGYDLGVDYAFQYHGPRTSLGVLRLLWRDRISLGASYHFQVLSFFHTDPAILIDPAQAGAFFGYLDPYRLGYLQEDIALDLRDSPLDPRRGAYLLVGAEEGGVYAGGAFTFEKLHAEGRGYVPLGGRVVAAARVEFGHLFVQGELGSPITRRFYLGGPSSHRGFNVNRLSPQVPSGLAGAPALPIGGDEMFLGQAEVRVNLVQLWGSWFGAAAFLDAGDVAEPACGGRGCMGGAVSIDFAHLHYAVGGGLRYRTLLGTIRADLGVRLNRLAAAEPDGRPNPDPGQRLAFHLSVGEAF